MGYIHVRDGAPWTYNGNSTLTYLLIRLGRAVKNLQHITRFQHNYVCVCKFMSVFPFLYLGCCVVKTTQRRESVATAVRDVSRCGRTITRFALVC